MKKTRKITSLICIALRKCLKKCTDSNNAYMLTAMQVRYYNNKIICDDKLFMFRQMVNANEAAVMTRKRGNLKPKIK